MRPSMMTLVSRILKDCSDVLLAAEQAAQRAQVQHVALVGAHHQADVGHPQQEQDLEERKRGGVGGERAGQNQRDQISADDSEQGTESRSKQSLECGFANLDFEENDRHADDESDRRGVHDWADRTAAGTSRPRPAPERRRHEV